MNEAANWWPFLLGNVFVGYCVNDFASSQKELTYKEGTRPRKNVDRSAWGGVNSA